MKESTYCPKGWCFVHTNIFVDILVAGRRVDMVAPGRRLMSKLSIGIYKRIMVNAREGTYKFRGGCIVHPNIPVDVSIADREAPVRILM